MILTILTAGADYRPLRTNVTLNPLQVTQNLAVDILQDSVTERTEAFGVRIIIPEETQQLGVTLGSPSVIPIRIADDDRKPLFEWSEISIFNYLQILQLVT